MRLNLKFSESMKDYLHFSVPLFLVSMLRFLLMYGDLLVVWCGVSVWEALTKRPLPVEWKWPLYFGVFVFVSFANWRKEWLRAHTAEATLAAERKKPSPIRIFAEHPESLLERYAHRGVRAEKLLAPYLDKWIRAGNREAALVKDGITARAGSGPRREIGRRAAGAKRRLGRRS